MGSVYVRPKEAAAQLRVSVSTVYRRARKGFLSYKREDGRIMIRVESVSETPAQTSPGAPIQVQSQTASSAAHSGGGQRELVPRQRARVTFFQTLSWQ
jgi:predicted site-specific integrase-resolvase